MTTFFQAISQALTDSNKRINVDITGLEGGRIKVVMSANLGPTPAKASEAECKLRAAIAKPLLLSGTPEEVEGALFERVRTHAEVVNHGMSALDEIRKLSEAAISHAKTPAAKQATPKAPAAAADAEDDEADGDDTGNVTPAAQKAEAAAQTPAPAPFANLAEQF
ncbi:PRTRC system protein E [Pseudomonas sp. V1]|uniref:PRTRC system protein E n=1 Tax=Pseudomonas arcuscaelestis TaxID=2710591 RepID=UPI00193FC0A3|nr:PRTRC system protein E [Pseudomonas arcuscaelestis]MBM3105664.1 PRTRC system protein E [Pseudomonas arcuscaelestis]